MGKEVFIDWLSAGRVEGCSPLEFAGVTVEETEFSYDHAEKLKWHGRKMALGQGKSSRCGTCEKPSAGEALVTLPET